MIGQASDCVHCKHFRRDKASSNACTAFPAGIPDAIFFDGRSHLKPYPGDHGIRFEPLEHREPEPEAATR